MSMLQPVYLDEKRDEMVNGFVLLRTIENPAEK